MCTFLQAHFHFFSLPRSLLFFFIAFFIFIIIRFFLSCLHIFFFFIPVTACSSHCHTIFFCFISYNNRCWYLSAWQFAYFSNTSLFLYFFLLYSLLIITFLDLFIISFLPLHLHPSASSPPPLCLFTPSPYLPFSRLLFAPSPLSPLWPISCLPFSLSPITPLPPPSP